MTNDLFKIATPTVVAILLKYLIDWIMKVCFSPQPTKQRRFNKIPVDQKIDVIEQIGELKEKTSTPHVCFQIKLLYEKIGIYLPVWHSHKLIAFLSSENINSLDERLIFFLKRSYIAACSTSGLTLNKKAFNWTLSLYLLFCMFTVSVFSYYGYFIARYFLLEQKGTLFWGAILSISCAVAIVMTSLFIQLAELCKGRKFCRLFEGWIRQNMQKTHAERSTVQTLTTSDPA